MVRFSAALVVWASVAANPISATAADWKPAPVAIKTRWAKDVNPAAPLPDYPRPHLTREKWLNLNGLWDYAILPRDAQSASQWDGQILVPFAVESSLSGVGKRVGPERRLWYRRRVTIPADWKGQRILLHFGAVDWESVVYVNGKEIGRHQGGYDPFSFDITDHLKEGEQEISLSVWDPSDASYQPRGKQVRNPGGIFYTPVTGIWQTVWLEPVAARYISRLDIIPNIDDGSFQITALAAGEGSTVTITLKDEAGEITAEGLPGQMVRVAPKQPKLWWPDAPHLYTLVVTLYEGGMETDRVGSYAGLRKSSLGKDEQGITRIMLNNKFIFQYGPLDQGYWPDGLYTAPTDEALRYDIEITKELGFNMARKHVKVEPARWYYWCDKLGLLVWQDMPSGDASISATQPDIKRTKESAENFEQEWKRIIDALRPFPSIVLWVPFNEGWGQYDTARIVKMTKDYDPTRLVDNASGWADRNVGDVHDWHVYPGPASPKPTDKRAAVLGEFGGLGLPIAGHTWQSEKNWGYRSFTTKEDLTAAYLSLMTNLRPLIDAPGLSAAVYTQTTDVEVEVNGLLTYDRDIIKMDVDSIKAAHARLYRPAPKLVTIVPTSREKESVWQYTTEKPADGWEQPGFDASKWKTGPAGFGEPTTPNSVVRTQWKTPDIWIRREIEIPSDATLMEPYFLMHHDEDVEIYVDGKLAHRGGGYTVDYGLAPIRKEAAAALTPGKHVLAAHCHQTGGGQYLDIGLIDARPAK